jgi:hypothetical protein
MLRKENRFGVVAQRRVMKMCVIAVRESRKKPVGFTHLSRGYVQKQRAFPFFTIVKSAVSACIFLTTGQSPPILSSACPHSFRTIFITCLWATTQKRLSVYCVRRFAILFWSVRAKSTPINAGSPLARLHDLTPLNNNITRKSHTNSRPFDHICVFLERYQKHWHATLIVLKTLLHIRLQSRILCEFNLNSK